MGRALLGAAIIVAISAALKWAAPAHLSPEWAQRLTGVLLGFVVVFYANVIPKSLTSMHLIGGALLAVALAAALLRCFGARTSTA